MSIARFRFSATSSFPPFGVEALFGRLFVGGFAGWSGRFRFLSRGQLMAGFCGVAFQSAIDAGVQLHAFPVLVAVSKIVVQAVSLETGEALEFLVGVRQNHWEPLHHRVVKTDSGVQIFLYCPPDIHHHFMQLHRVQQHGDLNQFIHRLEIVLIDEFSFCTIRVFALFPGPVAPGCK